MALWSKKPTTPAPGAQAPETPPAPQAAKPQPARSESAQPPQLMTPPPQAPAPAEATQSELSEEAKRNAAMLSKALMAALGQIVTVLMRTAEHRAKPLTDLEWLAIPAVMTGQFAVVEAQSKANGHDDADQLDDVGLCVTRGRPASSRRSERAHPPFSQ